MRFLAATTFCCAGAPSTAGAPVAAASETAAFAGAPAAADGAEAGGAETPSLAGAATGDGTAADGDVAGRGDASSVTAGTSAKAAMPAGAIVVELGLDSLSAAPARGASAASNLGA